MNSYIQHNHDLDYSVKVDWCVSALKIRLKLGKIMLNTRFSETLQITKLNWFLFQQKGLIFANA